MAVGVVGEEPINAFWLMETRQPTYTLLGGRTKWSSGTTAAVEPLGGVPTALGGFGAGEARGAAGGRVEVGVGGLVPGVTEADTDLRTAGVPSGEPVLDTGFFPLDADKAAAVSLSWPGDERAVAVLVLNLPAGLAAIVLASLLTEEAAVTLLRVLRTLRWLILLWALTVEPSSSLPSPLVLLALGGRLAFLSPPGFVALLTLVTLPVADFSPLPGAFTAECGADEEVVEEKVCTGVALRVNAGELSTLAAGPLRV